jgi:hypothetical protein
MGRDVADRDSLTFEQAEGAAPLRAALGPGEISRELRALLWALVHDEIERSTEPVGGRLLDPWRTILADEFVLHRHGMIDDFPTHWADYRPVLKLLFSEGNYVEIFGFLEWILRDKQTPRNLSGKIDWVLRHARAAYRVAGGRSIVPVGCEQPRPPIKLRLVDLRGMRPQISLGVEFYRRAI